jgi:hypothetical protein
MSMPSGPSLPEYPLTSGKPQAERGACKNLVVILPTLSLGTASEWFAQSLSAEEDLCGFGSSQTEFSSIVGFQLGFQRFQAAKTR